VRSGVSGKSGALAGGEEKGVYGVALSWMGVGRGSLLFLLLGSSPLGSHYVRAEGKFPLFLGCKLIQGGGGNKGPRISLFYAKANCPQSGENGEEPPGGGGGQRFGGKKNHD